MSLSALKSRATDAHDGLVHGSSRGSSSEAGQMGGEERAGDLPVMHGSTGSLPGRRREFAFCNWRQKAHDILRLISNRLL